MGRAGSSPAPGTQKGVLIEGAFFVGRQKKVATRACNVKEVSGVGGGSFVSPNSTLIEGESGVNRGHGQVVIYRILGN